MVFSGQEPPAHLINTWLCGYFPEEDNDDDDDDDDNPQSNGRKQQIPLKRRPLLSDYWLQIPYATVVLRYHLAEAVPFISSVVIESIYTATREVLAAHLPEELKPPTL